MTYRALSCRTASKSRQRSLGGCGRRLTPSFPLGPMPPVAESVPETGYQCHGQALVGPVGIPGMACP